MQVSSAWLSHVCGCSMPVDRAVGWLAEAGIAARAARLEALELDASPSPLTSVRGLADELRGRGGTAIPTPLEIPALPGGLTVTVEGFPNARLDAAHVRLAGGVEIPERERRWLDRSGIAATGTAQDVIAFVELELGYAVSARSAADLGADGVRLCGHEDGMMAVGFGAGDAEIGLPAGIQDLMVFASSVSSPGDARSAARLAAGTLALARVCQLLSEWAGAHCLAAGAAGPRPEPHAIDVPMQVVRRAIGQTTTPSAVTGALHRAGLHATVGAGNVLHVRVPPERATPRRPQDVLGSLARQHGLVPVLPPATAASRPSAAIARRASRARLRDAAIRFGLQEAITPALVQADGPAAKVEEARRGAVPPVRGRRGLREMAVRWSLLPGLLEAAARALDEHGAARLFEIGPVPRSVTPGDEAWHITAVLAGPVIPGSYVDPAPRPVALADALGLVHVLCGPRDHQRPEAVATEHPDARPGHAFAVSRGGVALGTIARLDTARAATLGIWATVHWVELDVDGVIATAPDLNAVRLPAARSASFGVTALVPEGMPAGRVCERVAAAISDRVSDVTVVGRRPGETASTGLVALAMKVRLFDLPQASHADAVRACRRAVEAELTAAGWKVG